jgi:bacteriocin-like protein
MKKTAERSATFIELTDEELQHVVGGDDGHGRHERREHRHERREHRHEHRYERREHRHEHY